MYFLFINKMVAIKQARRISQKTYKDHNMSRCTLSYIILTWQSVDVKHLTKTVIHLLCKSSTSDTSRGPDRMNRAIARMVTESSIPKDDESSGLLPSNNVARALKSHNINTKLPRI